MGPPTFGSGSRGADALAGVGPHPPPSHSSPLFGPVLPHAPGLGPPLRDYGQRLFPLPFPLLGRWGPARRSVPLLCAVVSTTTGYGLRGWARLAGPLLAPGGPGDPRRWFLAWLHGLRLRRPWARLRGSRQVNMLRGFRTRLWPSRGRLRAWPALPSGGPRVRAPLLSGERSRAALGWAWQGPLARLLRFFRACSDLHESLSRLSG